MKYCSKCGNELLDEAVICPKCGCPAESADKPKKKKGKAPKIFLIVFGVLMVLFVLGSLFGGEEDNDNGISANDEAAYACAQDLVECMMDLARNPHSMKVHTLKYDYTGTDATDMEFSIYIEYTFVGDNGSGREERGAVKYDVNMEEATFSMRAYDKVKFTGAALSGNFHLNSVNDTSGWTALDVSIIKEAVGLD